MLLRQETMELLAVVVSIGTQDVQSSTQITTARMQISILDAHPAEKSAVSKHWSHCENCVYSPSRYLTAHVFFLSNQLVNQCFYFRNKMMMMMIIIIIIINDLGHRITSVSTNDKEAQFLFQRLSIALQRFNAILLSYAWVVWKWCRPGPLADLLF